MQGPLAAAALWCALAVGSLFLRDEAGATLLIWLPSGVAVASLYATRVRRWPSILAVLGIAQFLTLLAYGPPLASLGFTLANLIEAILCAGLGIKLLGGRRRAPRTFVHVMGLFCAALVGCAAGTLLSMPFRETAGLDVLAWRYLATVLGVLAATPAMLYVRQWFGVGDQKLEFWSGAGARWFLVALAGMFALGVAVLANPVAALLPLLFMAIVFAVIRFGQLAAAWGVIAYAAAASALSLFGIQPAAFLAADPDLADVAMQGLMLLMLATALPIAAMLMQRDQLEKQLRAHNAEMRDNLTMHSLAESLAGIGRWRYELASGNQHWSPRMLELNGLPENLAGNLNNVSDMLPESSQELFETISEHREDREPFSFEYRIDPPSEGNERILQVHVTNEFDDSGQRIALFAVAMDVTEQVKREQALQFARQRAVALAAQAQKMANTDPLTGIANRRATFDWLERMVEASRECEEPLTVLIFDIDHFKRINDCFGHQTGDEVLRRIASIARDQIRAEDLVGRIGGEEFVCILSGMTDLEARGLAERMCHAIADGSSEGNLPRVTISIGLAQFRAEDATADLLGRADAALYEAKDGGRNQVRRAA